MHFPTIQTPRFRLRVLRQEDAPALFDYFADPELTRYYDRGPFLHLDEVRGLIDARARAFAEGRSIRWAIARMDDDHLIGTVGFHGWDKHSRKAEIGYEVARSQQGQGVMTEVLPAVLRHGFTEMNLNRMEALFHPDNSGSRRVLEKAGFAYEGTLRQYVLTPDGFWDAVVMSLLKQEWTP